MKNSSVKTLRKDIVVLLGIYALLTLCSSVIAGVESDFVKATNANSNNYFLGKTGFGTTNPVQQMHVVGDSRLDGGLTVDGALRVPKQGDVEMGPFTNGVSDQGVVSSNWALRGSWLSYDGTSQGIYVSTNGRVGIGSAVPSFSLDVSGSIGASTITLGGETRTNFSDPGISQFFYANAPGTQSVPASAYTKVIFTQERSDWNNSFNPSNSRWTPSVGRYLVNVELAVPASTVSDFKAFYIVLYRNGVQTGPASPMSLASSGIMGAHMSVWINQTAATNYYEVYTWHNNSVAIGLVSNMWYGETCFSATKLGQ